MTKQTALDAQGPRHDDSLRVRIEDALPSASAGRVDFRAIFAEATENAVDHDILGLGAELAYRSVLTLLPFLLFVAALPSVIGAIFSVHDVAGSLSREASSVLSKNSADMVHTVIGEVTRSQGWTAVFLGLSGSMFAGSSCISSVGKALNRIYGFDHERPFLERKTREVLLTVAVGFLFTVAAFCVLVGPVYLKHDGAGVFASALAGVLLVLAAVSLIYWLAPTADASFRWITPGSLLFAAGWLVFSLGFSAYLSRFSTVNRVYGSLGVMIVLLIWLYGSNIALLLGAELNAALGHRFDKDVQATSRS